MSEEVGVSPVEYHPRKSRSLNTCLTAKQRSFTFKTYHTLLIKDFISVTYDILVGRFDLLYSIISTCWYLNTDERMFSSLMVQIYIWCTYFYSIFTQLILTLLTCTYFLVLMYGPGWTDLLIFNKLVTYTVLPLYYSTPCWQLSPLQWDQTAVQRSSSPQFFCLSVYQSLLPKLQ